MPTELNSALLSICVLTALAAVCDSRLAPERLTRGYNDSHTSALAIDSDAVVYEEQRARSLQQFFSFDSVPAPTEVFFYEHSDFEGFSVVYKMPSDRDRSYTETVTWVGSDRNDKFSSVKIGSEVYLSVFDDAHQHRRSDGGGFSDMVLSSARFAWWTDRISSFSIQFLPEVYCTMFKDPFDGDFYSYGHAKLFETGRFSHVDLSDNRLHDSISAIDVPDSTAVKVFKHRSFLGRSLLIPGPAKVKLPEYEFDDIISSFLVFPKSESWENKMGYWQRVTSVGTSSQPDANGTARIEYTLSSGYTTEEIVSSGTALTRSLAMSFERGFSFQVGGGAIIPIQIGGDVQMGVNEEVTRSVSRSISIAVSKTEEKTCATACFTNSNGGSVAVYQWTVTATAVNGKDIELSSCEFLCMHGNNEPRCPLNDCADQGCQTCKTYNS